MSRLQNSPPPAPGKSGLRVPVGLIVVGLVLIPFVAGIIWYTRVRTSGSSAVRKLEQNARQRGEPVTLAELATNYPAIPDGENAAVALIEIWTQNEPEVWAAFAAGANDLPEGQSENFDPVLPYLGAEARTVLRDRRLSAESLAAAESFLTENADHLKAVRSAMRRPKFRFDIHFQAGPAAPLPHLTRLRREATCFRMEALVAAEKGDVAQAMRSLEDIHRTGELLANEPALLSQLVRVAILGLGLESMEQLLSRQQLAGEQLSQLQVLLERSRLNGAAKAALIYERPMSLTAFDSRIAAQTLTSEPGQSADEAADAAYVASRGLKLMQTVGYMTPDRRLMLETFEQAIDLAGKETPQALQQYEAVFATADAEARKFPPKLFSSMLLPALRKVPLKFATYEARRRGAMTAIAVERYRAKHRGTLPGELAALVPEFLPAVPQDPYDGAPLRFKQLTNGFVVYSIGSDHEDDHGLERPPRGGRNRDDTFVVERATKDAPNVVLPRH